jgi:hypothetical protein
MPAGLMMWRASSLNGFYFITDHTRQNKGAQALVHDDADIDYERTHAYRVDISTGWQKGPQSLYVPCTRSLDMTCLSSRIPVLDED